ncbi:dTDP-4-dehydrorhamnose reductase [soil metagenome]
MNLLVTGAGGMLGQTLCPYLAKRGHSVAAFGKEEFDITDQPAVQRIIEEQRPDLIVHCAAYTLVDQAETDVDLAFAINERGTENVAIAAGKLGIPMLFVSTDYVFDGSSATPYTINCQTGPISIYGKSKLAGELAVKRHCPNHYIVRTSWLYGPYGRNFVDTIYKLAEERDQIKVVADQVGSPTSTITLSEMIADLIASKRCGVYHATDDGVTTWYDFAREIVKHLESKGKKVEVWPIETKDMPRPAPRPAYSALDKSELVAVLGRPLTPWQEALHEYLRIRSVKAPA